MSCVSMNSYSGTIFKVFKAFWRSYRCVWLRHLSKLAYVTKAGNVSSAASFLDDIWQMICISHHQTLSNLVHSQLESAVCSHYLTRVIMYDLGWVYKSTANCIEGSTSLRSVCDYGVDCLLVASSCNNCLFILWAWIDSFFYVISLFIFSHVFYNLFAWS